MKFIPNSSEKNKMLKEMKIKNIDYLFADIPSNIKIKKLDLPKGLSQQETEKKLRGIANNNKSYNDILSFIGGGIKPHYIPSIVKSIISRSEFYTAYTPYQSEASQGFLQAMFEYQSMIADLTGMDIANASLYDGGTALSEAALMCVRIKRKKSFIIPENISWEKKSILSNYLKGPDIKIVEVPYDKKTGKVDVKELEDIIDGNVAGVYIENPNFFGVFEDNVNKISNIAKENGSLFVVGVDPISLGVIKKPGDYNADIVIGEGRALGNPVDYGGSSLGLFSCKQEFLRQMPGRVIGMTNDNNGKRAFCMALQTREQHIRRGRATSNICTNEGLCALASACYLSWYGSQGFEKLSKINFENGQKLSKELNLIKGFKRKFESIHFNEFVIQTSTDVRELNKKLLKNNIQGGLILDKHYPDLKNCMLFGITELHCEEDIKKISSVLKEVMS